MDVPCSFKNIRHDNEIDAYFSSQWAVVFDFVKTEKASNKGVRVEH